MWSEASFQDLKQVTCGLKWNYINIVQKRQDYAFHAFNDLFIFKYHVLWVCFFKLLCLNMLNIFPNIFFYRSSLCDKVLIKCYTVVEHVLNLTSQSGEGDFTRTYYDQYVSLSFCRQPRVPVRLFLFFFLSLFLSLYVTTLWFWLIKKKSLKEILRKPFISSKLITPSHLFAFIKIRVSIDDWINNVSIQFRLQTG